MEEDEQEVSLPLEREGLAIFLRELPTLQNGMGRALDRRPYYLKGHPFGLPIPQDHRFDGDVVIMCLGDPGYTDESVATFCTYVANYLQFEQARISYLRIIRAEIELPAQRSHDLFYEAGFQRNEVVICGGCNDVSGAGGYGKYRMDRVFAFLAWLHALRIQTATVINPAAGRWRKAFLEEISDISSRRERGISHVIQS